MYYMNSVASLLVKHLKKWNISHVFGIPGKPVVPLIIELDNQEIQFVLSKHESGAGFEAAGYALAKDSLGVAVGTSGPGGTNMLTAAGQAKAYHLPVLFITGHPTMQGTGRALGQDSSVFGTDLVKMFESVTKFSVRVERGDLFPIYLKHALEIAFSGKKGPVHLSIPSDVFTEQIDDFSIDLPVGHGMISTELDNVVEALNKAERPLLFLGKGVHSSRAYEEVEQLSNHLRIPVMTTPGGKGTFRSNHPLSLGAFGLGGTLESEQYVRDGVDVMVVLGSKLSDMSLAGFSEELYPKQVIHFDIDPTFIGKSLPIQTISVIGDLKLNLQAMLQKMNVDITQEIFSCEIADNEDHTSECGEYVSASRAVKAMRSVLPVNTILFGDDGSHSFYGIQNFDILEPGTFYFDDVFGTMGHAIGYSIGAKLANPDRPIVCLTGDGCTLMHGSEIMTAVNYNVPVIFVVFNNGRLDMVEKGMSRHAGKAVGVIYQQPLNVAMYASAMGADSYRCVSEQELKDAIQLSLKANRTSVIEVMVDPEEVPPTMKRG